MGRWPAWVQMDRHFPIKEISSVWSMTQNKLTGHLSFRDCQWKDGAEEQKAARERVVFKSKNPSAAVR